MSQFKLFRSWTSKRLKIRFVSGLFVVLIWLSGVNICSKAFGESGTSSVKSRHDSLEIRQLIHASKSFNLQSPGQIDSSLASLNKALFLLQSSADSRYLFQVYEQFGLIYSVSGNYPIELDYRFKMLELIDNGGFPGNDSLTMLAEYATQYARIGICYFNMDNYNKALSWYRKSLDVVNRLVSKDKNYPGQSKLMSLFGNIGSVYLSTYNFWEAEKNFEKALEISHKLGNPESNAMLYNNLGIVYKERKDFEKAFDYYNKALVIRQTLRDTAAMAQTYNNIGDALYLTGKYAESLIVLSRALEMSRQTGSLRSQMKAANFLSLSYEKTGNMREARSMFKLYKSLHESIISNEILKNTTRLELKSQ